MMELNLTMKEAERYKVISEVEGGYLKVGEAAEILSLSERQVYRIKARVRREGAGGVIHKSKGKKAPLWLTEKIKDKIDHFYKTKYRGFNLTHMAEFLNMEERIRVSRESVRQILLEKGSPQGGAKKSSPTPAVERTLLQGGSDGTI
jgi:transposase